MTWQPIASAPHDGTDLLLAWQWESYDFEIDAPTEGWYIVSGNFYSAPGYNESNGWWQDNAAVGCVLPELPTHWMPLPAPPVTE